MKKMPLKIFFMTFGCKVNQYETQNLIERFESDGHARTDRLSDADVCVINSCTVTSQADSKLRHFLSRVGREAPDCVTALIGCFPQAFPEKAEELGMCDIICGTKDKGRLPELVYKALAERPDSAVVSIPKHEIRSVFEPMCNSFSAEKTRAYIKIQDGCDLFCTYCIIPYARGHICSKPLEDIAEEARRLAESGHRELILTGINICCYGRDLGVGTRLIDAVETACGIDGIERVRLGSIEPEMISDDDIERMRALPKLCPHFHLSLQSGCDRTLAAMKRHYTTDEYYSLCRRLRTAFPDCAITTDIMVGFPGETEDDHRASMAFAEEVGFAAAHIFPYSRRSGTPADHADGQIDKHTKSIRAAEMAEICRRSRLEYNRSFIGRTVSVLFEKEHDPAFHQGHSREYLLVKVAADNGESWRREIKDVIITDAEQEYCIGHAVGTEDSK